LKLPQRLLGGIVVEMDPAHPVPDVGHQRIVVALLGQLQGATEIDLGTTDLANIERGPSAQIVQVGDGHAEPIHDHARGRTGEHPHTPGQVANHGVLAGAAAVLISRARKARLVFSTRWTSLTPTRPGTRGSGGTRRAARGEVSGTKSGVDMTSLLTDAKLREPPGTGAD
jgi:hypothetical protein